MIAAQWPAANNIRAYTTTREGGYSKAPYASFNLGDHVGDNPVAVMRNRQRLIDELSLPQLPAWLQQTHSTTVVAADKVTSPLEADASYTNQAGVVCCVLTADCLPILLCDKQGSCVAAIHAGWRGLVNGIIENTVTSLPAKSENLLAWLGPAIGPNHFEVGEEVLAQFVAHDPKAQQAFIAQPNKKWLANIYQLAQQRLKQLAISQIFGGDLCTVSDDRFYSYRGDGGQTGRMASLIYILPPK